MPAGNLPKRRMVSRLRELAGHTVRYSIDWRSRLAADTDLSRAEVTKLLSGDCSPTYRVVLKVVEALERELGIRLDSRDVLSFDGEFRCSVCELVSCRGCPACRPPGLSRIPQRRGEEVPCPLPPDR